MTTRLPSRGTLGWLGALLAGGLSAAAFAFAFAFPEAREALFFLAFLPYIAPMPLLVTGLGAGILPVMLAGLVATAGIYLKTQPAAAISYFILMAFPAILLTALALRHRLGADGKIYWYPEGHLLTAAVIYPCLLFLMAAGFASGEEGGLLGVTAPMLQEGLRPFSEGLQPEAADRFKEMLDFLPRIFPAIMGCGWMVLFLANLLSAQSTLKQQHWNLRDFAWRDLQMPNWLLFAAAATGVMGVFAPEPFGYIGMNLSFMLCTPFFFTGLAVVHAYAATRRTGLMFLIIFYIFLSLLIWLSLVVTLLGALDQGFNFRQRLARLPQRPGKKGEKQ